MSNEINIFKQKAGSNPKYSHSVFGDDQAGTDELIRIAECDRNGNNDEQINEAIESMESSYCYDQTTYFFETN